MYIHNKGQRLVVVVVVVVIVVVIVVDLFLLSIVLLGSTSFSGICKQPRPFTSILGVNWNFESITKNIKNLGAFVFHALFLSGLLLADNPLILFGLFYCLDLRV